MVNPRMTGFLIALVLISFFAGLFSLFAKNITDNYHVTYDNSTLDQYNQFSNLSSNVEDIEEATNIKEKAGILDVIGGYFSGAYSALKLTGQSINIFTSMSDQAIDDANLGAVGEHLRITIILIVMLLIFVGVFISALLKWWI